MAREQWSWSWWCPVCKKYVGGANAVRLENNIEGHIYFHEFLARLRFVNESFSNGWNPKFYDILFLRSCGIKEESVLSKPRVGIKR